MQTTVFIGLPMAAAVRGLCNNVVTAFRLMWDDVFGIMIESHTLFCGRRVHIYQDSVVRSPFVLD